MTDAAGIICCSSCSQPYHEQCIESVMNQSLLDLAAWLCPTCKPKRDNRDGTPVRGAEISNKHKAAAENITYRRKNNVSGSLKPERQGSSNGDCAVTSEEVRRIVKSEMDELLARLNDTMTNHVKKELISIREEMGQVKESMKFMNDQYEDMKNQLKKKIDSINELEKENYQLKASLGELGTRVAVIEQQARSANAEVQCLCPNSKTRTWCQL